MLLEKAWAKSCGTYARTFGGRESEALKFLTGAPCERIIINEMKQEKLVEMLEDAFTSKKYLMYLIEKDEKRKEGIDKTGLFTG